MFWLSQAVNTTPAHNHPTEAPAPLALFLVAPPGLEAVLAAEASALGIAGTNAVPGGVEATGTWATVRLANVQLRCCDRVLLRLTDFPAAHLAQLDKRVRAYRWDALLTAGTPVRVEASCKASRIYHTGAVTGRITAAIRAQLGADNDGQAPVRVLARIERNRCTLSLDTSGEPLHKRGSKLAIGKAPLRETLAAAMLHQCGFDGHEPVLDPLCGSGTLVLEAAAIAAGHAAGTARGFAFEQLADHDAAAWADERATNTAIANRPVVPSFLGYDRDAGAIDGARANAARAGLEGWTQFATQPISALQRPDGPAGLVILNPPYGDRIGDKAGLRGLYATLGRVLRAHFQGWRVGLITSDATLARQTKLPFLAPSAPVPHGGLRIKLWRTAAL